MRRRNCRSTVSTALSGRASTKPVIHPNATNCSLSSRTLPAPTAWLFPRMKSIYTWPSRAKSSGCAIASQPDGSVTDGSLFLDASSEPEKGGPDGLRVDKRGNIYGSGPGGVWIISPEGKHLGTIKVPEVVSNVAWQGKDGKTLYITASTTVFRIKLKASGVRN